MTLTAIAILLLLILLVLLYMAGFFSWLAERADDFWGEDTGAGLRFWGSVFRWGGYAALLFVVIKVFDNVGDTFSDKYLVFVALAGIWLLYSARAKR